MENKRIDGIAVEDMMKKIWNVKKMNAKEINEGRN